jgi:hypothetical protein
MTEFLPLPSKKKMEKHPSPLSLDIVGSTTTATFGQKAKWSTVGANNILGVNDASITCGPPIRFPSLRIVSGVGVRQKDSKTITLSKAPPKHRHDRPEAEITARVLTTLSCAMQAKILVAYAKGTSHARVQEDRRLLQAQPVTVRL